MCWWCSSSSSVARFLALLPFSLLPSFLSFASLWGTTSGSRKNSELLYRHSSAAAPLPVRPGKREKESGCVCGKKRVGAARFCDYFCHASTARSNKRTQQIGGKKEKEKVGRKERGGKSALLFHEQRMYRMQHCMQYIHHAIHPVIVVS